MEVISQKHDVMEQMAADAHRLANASACIVAAEPTEMLLLHDCPCMPLRSFSRTAGAARGVVYSQAALARAMDMDMAHLQALATLMGSSEVSLFPDARALIAWTRGNLSAAQKLRVFMPISPREDAADLMESLMAHFPKIKGSAQAKGEERVRAAMYEALAAAEEGWRLAESMLEESEEYVREVAAEEWLLQLVDAVWEKLRQAGKVSERAFAQGRECLRRCGQEGPESGVECAFSVDTYVGCVAFQSVLGSVLPWIQQQPVSSVLLFNPTVFFGLEKTAAGTFVPKHVKERPPVEEEKPAIAKAEVKQKLVEAKPKLAHSKPKMTEMKPKPQLQPKEARPRNAKNKPERAEVKSGSVEAKPQLREEKLKTAEVKQETVEVKSRTEAGPKQPKSKVAEVKPKTVKAKQGNLEAKPQSRKGKPKTAEVKSGMVEVKAAQQEQAGDPQAKPKKQRRRRRGGQRRKGGQKQKGDAQRQATTSERQSQIVEAPTQAEQNGTIVEQTERPGSTAIADRNGTKQSSKREEQRKNGMQQKRQPRNAKPRAAQSEPPPAVMGTGDVDDGRVLVAPLPVDAHYETLMSHIAKNRITIIHGETGCGKSSRIPAMILQYTEGRAKMMVSQPRRIAARSLRERLQTTLDSPDRKELVGLRLGGGVVEETAQTRIWFCTAGYLSRKISRDPSFFDSHTHLILDEVHERSVDMDVLCLYTKKLLESNKTIKILLMSATLQAHVFKEYFSIKAPPLFVGAKRFELTEVFVDCKEFSLLTYNAPTLHPRASGLVEQLSTRHIKTSCKFGTVAIARHIIQAQHDLTIELCRALARESLKERELGSEGGGAILVFVSGMSDCFDLSYKFEQLPQIQNDPAKYVLTIIHSMVPIEEQMKAWDKAGPGEVKIVIATNAGESSLTLPDVDYVICLGTRKENRYNQQTKCSELVNTWISKASAVQRAGRTARTRPGKVFRMYSRALFDKMSDFDTPEILSTPLDKVILDLKYTTDKEVLPVLEELVEPPPKASANNAIVSLYEHRMISSCSDKSTLTAIGKIAANLPVDLRIGHFVVLGSLLGCASTVLPVVAALNAARSPFRVATTLVHQDPDEYHGIVAQTMRARDALDGGLFSEPLAVTRLISVLAHSSTSFAKSFCLDNGIVWARARQLFSAYTQLRRVVCELAGLPKTALNVPPPREILADPAEVNRVRLAMVLTNPRNLLLLKQDYEGMPTARVYDASLKAHCVRLKLDSGLTSLEAGNVASLFPPSVRWKRGDHEVSSWSAAFPRDPTEVENMVKRLVDSASRFVSKRKVTPDDLLTGTLGGSAIAKNNTEGLARVRAKEVEVDLLALAASSGKSKQKGKKKGKQGGGVVSDESGADGSPTAGLFSAVLIEINLNPPMDDDYEDFYGDYSYGDYDDFYGKRYDEDKVSSVLYVHNSYTDMAKTVTERCMLFKATMQRGSYWNRFDAKHLKSILLDANFPKYMIIELDASLETISVSSYNVALEKEPVSQWLYECSNPPSRCRLTGRARDYGSSTIRSIDVYYTDEEEAAIAAKAGTVADVPYGVRLLGAYASGNRPRDTIKVEKLPHQRDLKGNYLQAQMPTGLNRKWKFLNDYDIATAHSKRKAELKKDKGIMPVQHFEDDAYFAPNPYFDDGFSDASDELRKGGTKIVASTHTKASVLAHLEISYDSGVYALADSITMIGRAKSFAKAENITLLPPSEDWLKAMKTCIPNTEHQDEEVVKLLNAQDINASDARKLFIPNQPLIDLIDAKFEKLNSEVKYMPLPDEFIEHSALDDNKEEAKNAKKVEADERNVKANPSTALNPDSEEFTPSRSSWYD